MNPSLDGFRTLDATCSAARRWPRSATVRVDIAPGASPDVIADARRLPFADDTFDAIYCDPPHLIGKSNTVWAANLKGHCGPEFGRFSFFETVADWRRFCEQSGREFARVLKPGGLLLYKVPDGSRAHGHAICHTDVLKLPGFRLARDDVRQGRGPRAAYNRSIGRAPSVLHYLTLERAR